MRKVVVLAPVLGGVPVAHEAAKHLDKPLDFVLTRKLLLPNGPGSDVNAVNVAGTLLIDENTPPIPATPSTPLDYFLKDAITRLQERARICRGSHVPLELTGTTVLLVDCGVHTGATMQAAIRAVRKTAPKRVIAAAPVTAREGRDIVAKLADEFIFLYAPKTFGNTAMWYEDFSRPAEDEVAKLLRP